MAINFEAANMAGYNNPKIEVFKAVVDLGTNAVTSAPNKTEIIRCLHRGSIPALVTFSPDGSEISMLWVSAVIDSEGITIAFGPDSYQIVYLPNSEHPIFNS